MNAVLEARNVTVRFGGLVAVNEANLTIGRGQIRGLIGPNGAGKTTFFNAISGLVAAQEGTVSFKGQDVTRQAAHVRARMGIRRTFQAIQLSARLTVLENVLLGAHSRITDGFWKILFTGNPRACGDWVAQQAARRTLRYLELDHLALVPAGKLTFAQQRQVELARALIAEPTLLMLDEPAAGLSPSEIEQLDRTLVRLRDEIGLSILLVEHVISLVMNVCDRVTVLEQGRVIAEGEPASIARDSNVKRAYLGDERAAG